MVTTQLKDTPVVIDKMPHLLKYMGSKREIIEFVTDSIRELNADSNWICDLFAGTSVVSGSLKNIYNVHANDIQLYSSIFSHTYFSNLKGIAGITIKEIQEKCLKKVNEFKVKYPQHVYNYGTIQTLDELNKLEAQQQNLLHDEFNIGFHLFVKNYSGTYWSFEQCLWIDSIRAVAEIYAGKPEYYAILSSLIFSMSYNSPSTGHYAQYRDATTDNMQDILSYRNRDIWSYFEKKFDELVLTIGESELDHKISTLDYLDCLRIIKKGSIVYADPPYQSVHYSRFYHALETLVRYDYPKVHYKGRYREDRHQSPFCKKTTVNSAFSNLFQGIADKKSHLVLSYSDTGMITLEDVKKIAKTVFKNTYELDVLEKEHIHSKMGRSDIRQQGVVEYSINFRRK
ncbi:adenine-specific DNA-methyltransferase [Mucilaginibacter sp. UYP25]|uniref:DNA adenine methylase n=1 Tax=unclassified Mucilaginibacter TaxID=2617802 RepID=UPI0033988A4C